MSYRDVARYKKFNILEKAGSVNKQDFKNKPTEYEKYRRMIEQRKERLKFSEVLENAKQKENEKND